MGRLVISFRKIFIIFSGAVLIFVCCNKEVFVEPNETDIVNSMGKIKVDSYPQGASIYIDDRNSGFVTPILITALDTGSHTIKLKRSFTYDIAFTANVSSSKVDSVFIDYSTRPNMLGSIVCNSNPTGMKIYFNGVFTGKYTPYTFNNLFPDEYNIKYCAPDYWDENETIVLYSSKTKNSFAEMNDSLDIIVYNDRNSILFEEYFGSLADVNNIGEDKNGIIWFGTNKEKGLYRYDGKNFSSYKSNFYNPNFVSSNKITDMRSDTDNNLWICFSNGPEIFDGHNWTHFKIAGMSYGLSVNGLNVAATTQYSGLITYKDGKFNQYLPSNSGIRSGEISAASFDKDGKVWAQN